MPKYCSRLLILADVSSFYIFLFLGPIMQAYEFVIVLYLPSTSLSLVTIEKAQGGRKNGQIPLF